MNMENIRERAISIKPNGKNYLVRGWQLMVTKAKKGIEKAESDKTRTQFWVTIGMTTTVIPIVIALCSWFTVHLMNFGAQQARQEMFDKETKRLEQVILDKEKEIQTLMQKQQAQSPDSDVNQPKPKPRRAPQGNARGRGRFNGQTQDLRATPGNPAPETYTPFRGIKYE
jgi:hypothetical protein